MSQASKFRAELKKLMPGYSWTVHKSSPDAVLLIATGTVSSGFNRLSTLEITKLLGDEPWYCARSAGFGKAAAWVREAEDRTLARALRTLQETYEANARYYNSLASHLQKGRQAR